MKKALIVISIFCLCLVFSLFDLPFSQKMVTPNGATITGFEPKSLIVINETEYTWFGNFVVNETDTVLIQNCNFTVKDGDIYVYGNLTVMNSTLAIKGNIFDKGIWVYGNLTFQDSKAKAGDLGIFCYEDSEAKIDGSEFSFIWALNASVFVSNSNFSQISPYYGNVDITNSTGEVIEPTLRPSTSLSLINVNITGHDSWGLGFYLGSDAPESINSLQIPSGQVDRWELSDIGADLNISISHCFINRSRLFVSNHPNNLCIYNSTLVWMGFYVESTPLQGTCNFTLQPGFLEHEDIVVDQNFNVTILNSTVKEWSIGIRAPGIYRFSNSNFSSMCWQNSDVSICNSTMRWLCTRFFYGNLLVSNTTINAATLGIDSGSMNLSLAEGYQGFTNFYNEQQGFNVTFIDSKVNYWGLELSGDPNIEVFNTTLSGMGDILGTHFFAAGDSKVDIYDSSLANLECVTNAHVTITNSTINSLVCYDDANVTATNCTVGCLITDPPIVTLINSKKLSEVQLSLPISVSSSMTEHCPASLPDGLSRVVEYLTLNALDYKGTFEAQIKMYYDEECLNMIGVGEKDLRIYCLEEGSGNWQPCPVQGINTTESYVWANVTHFSCFVITAPSGWKLDFTGPTNHPIIDFAVYNGNLYAAADNKLYVKDESSWNAISAPAFVTSLEPYGGKLVVGGKGGLYCYDGTSFSLIFSVPTYIRVLGAYNNTLYAGTMLDNPPKLYYCDGSAENPADWHIDTGFSTLLNFSGAFGSIDSFWASNNNMGAPVGYWKFDEGAGSVAFDSSGNNFDGAVNGANWTDGILNKALEFDGQDDYVEVLDSTELNPPAITVAAWVNFKGFPEPGENGWRNSVIASKGTDVLVDGNYVLFTCAQFVDGAHMYFQITEQGQYTYVGGNTIIVEDEWYYVVGTYDGSILRVYVNGVLDGEAVLNTQRTSNTENLQIGAMRMLGNGYWTNGTIDEVKIYGYAKTPEEIWNDYLSGIGNMYVASGNSVYCYDGTNWSVAVSYDDVSAFLAMKSYDGKLYLATRDQGWRKPLYQGGTGFSGRVIGFDGENWTTVLDYDYWIYSLGVYDGKLYAGTANRILTYNGTDWETSFNATEGAYYAISMINYDGKIYAGMGNGYIFADPAPPKAVRENIVVPEFPQAAFFAVFAALTVLSAVSIKKKHPKKTC
jgi:hypothetical protein